MGTGVLSPGAKWPGRNVEHVERYNFTLHKIIIIINDMPIPVTAPSKTWVCGRSLTGIVGSNLAGGMDMFLVSVVCCQVDVSASV